MDNNNGSENNNIEETSNSPIEEPSFINNPNISADTNSSMDAEMTVQRSVIEWAEVISYALALMIFIFLFIFKYVTVDGESMFPTLTTGDRLIISDLAYTPETGDIIVVTAHNHEKPLIKRVIASSGQEVEINFETWEVKVDGILIDQSYLSKAFVSEGEWMRHGDHNGRIWNFTVGEDKVFVMGDNRQNSSDSRLNSVGELDYDFIIGKVIIRVYPINQFGKV